MSPKRDAEDANKHISMSAIYRQLDDHLGPDEQSCDAETGLERLRTWMSDEIPSAHGVADLEPVPAGRQQATRSGYAKAFMDAVMDATLPLLWDSMLLQLANDIVVAEDISRRQRTLIGRMSNEVTGQEQRGGALSLQALAGGERTLMAWVTEVCESGRVTNLTLARVTRHVMDTRRALDALDADQRGTTTRVSQLTRDFEVALARVDDKFAQVHSRLDSLEEGLYRVKLRQLADRGFDESVEAWAFGKAYKDLPWACQVVLLAREVAHGPVSLLEHAEGERGYRERLVQRVLQILQHDDIPAARKPFAITRLFNDAVAELGGGERQLVAELLESGLGSDFIMPVGPLTALLRTILELRDSHGAQPERLRQRALSMTRERYGWVDGAADVEAFVRCVITEQADSALELRSALSG